MTKLTVWLAIGFFLISFGLAYTAKERAASLNLIGIPTVEAPAPAEESAFDIPEVPDETPERLTPEPESVDSDIPDV